VKHASWILLSMLSLAHADEKSAEKPLSQLNALTKMLGGDQPVVAGEVERLLEQSEVIAFRDATRGPSPQAITYAATVERTLDSYVTKGAGPARVLVELAISLAPLGGPQAHAQVERFRPMLLATLGVAPSEAKEMPELPAQLAEVYAWAARTVEKWASKLPPSEGTLARIRVLVERGSYAEAAQLAKAHNELGSRGLAWQAAALTLLGSKDAVRPAQGALQSGGEAAAIVRAARNRRMRGEAAATVEKSLGGSAAASCKKWLQSPAGGGGAEVAQACAIVLWNESDRGWLARAAQLVPSGPLGAPVRAAEDLRVLFGLGTARPDASGRAGVGEKYRGELARMDLAADERRALTLLGEVAGADNPLLWAPATPDTQKLMLELDRGAPCDAGTFPLRALAVRGNPEALGAFAAGVLRRCVRAPGGGAVAVDAVNMLLALAHEKPAHAPAEAVEELAAELAEAHPDDPAAVGAHADAVALKALAGKRQTVALQAALARYEEAIARATPAGGAAQRARLEANAGFLSLTLAEGLDDKHKPPFFQRAQRHLRFALALDESPAVLATRARFDTLMKVRAGAPPPLERAPATPARSRAACLLAAQASAAGEHAGAKKWLDLARAAVPSPSGEATSYDAPELLVAPEASFNVALEERALKPAAAMRTAIYLAPRCDPDTVVGSR
jgi:hypothetical protein